MRQRSSRRVDHEEDDEDGHHGRDLIGDQRAHGDAEHARDRQVGDRAPDDLGHVARVEPKR